MLFLRSGISSATLPCIRGCDAVIEIVYIPARKSGTLYCELNMDVVIYLSELPSKSVNKDVILVGDFLNEPSLLTWAYWVAS